MAVHEGVRHRVASNGSGARETEKEIGEHVHDDISEGAPQVPAGGMLYRMSSALRYDPGEIRVRLSIVKDILRVSRARWMDAIFKFTLLIVTVQLLPSMYRLACASGLSLKGLHLAVSELKLADAVGLLFYELGVA